MGSKLSKIIYRNGTFEGDCYLGYPHGWGTYSDPNGNILNGDWWMGAFTGHGKMDGYEGEFLQDRKHGKGKYTLYYQEKEYTFSGNWVNDKFTGKGFKILHASIDHEAKSILYEGDMVNDKMEGEGILYLDSSPIASGTWRNNRFIKGQFLYPLDPMLFLGDFKIEPNLVEGTFIGHVKNGKPSRGLLTFQDYFQDGVWTYQGFTGRTYWPMKNGTYRGEMRNGLRHGNGEHTFPFTCNSDTKNLTNRGLWDNDRFSGTGYLYNDDYMEYYHGEIQNDKKNGYGTLFHIHGMYDYGLYENDKLIRPVHTVDIFQKRLMIDLLRPEQMETDSDSELELVMENV